jgi:Lar family restriction alleviation protein
MSDLKIGDKVCHFACKVKNTISLEDIGEIVFITDDGNVLVKYRSGHILERSVSLKGLTKYLEIATCPFCGGNAQIEDQGSDTFNRDYYAVTCSKCSSIGLTSLNKEEAIAAWNKRV